MTGPIVVGVDGTGSGLDAVALATRLARATGDPLIVACVYPEGRRSSLDAAAAVHGPAAKALEAARALAQEAAAEYRTEPSGSPARGLAELAEQEDAAMVVVGSHRGCAFGRVASRWESAHPYAVAGLFLIATGGYLLLALGTKALFPIGAFLALRRRKTA